MSETVAALLIVAAIVTALGAIGKALVWTWKTLTKVARLADGLLGVPPSDTSPGRPGVLERLGAIEDLLLGAMPRLEALELRLSAVESQLQLKEET